MNWKILIILGFFLSSQSFGQSEFVTYDNGLIYNEKTMKKLKSIVDSLNLKYKTCDPNPVIYSKSQTVAHQFSLKKGNLKNAAKDLENQIPFEEFIRKYPKTEVDKNVLVVKYQYVNYDDEDVVKFSEIDLNGGYGYSMYFRKDPSLYDKDLKGQWLFESQSKTSYSEDAIKGFYFPREFESSRLKMDYALMVGYANCMIDTTTQKIKENAEDGWVTLPTDWTSMSQSEKEILLNEMRSTRVVGFCSMDDRPRQHAANIAVLSAETSNWQVFLKAHLDILNDNFQRASDGSYAWERRKTLIKELEELDINVSDLIIGISLRIENPSKNHYYGSIRRIGRALAEASNRENIEESILSMVSDYDLDDFNRVLSYYIFKNYVYYSTDEELKVLNAARLELAVATLPKYLREKIPVE